MAKRFFFFLKSSLRILKESIKVILSGSCWKSMAIITTLSLAIPSIFVLLFDILVHFVLGVHKRSYHDYGNNNNNKSKMLLVMMYTPLLIAAEVALLQAYFVFSDLISLATIHASSMAYIGTRISLSDLYRLVGKSSNKRLTGSQKSGIIQLAAIAFFVYILIIYNKINLVTICLSIFLSIAFSIRKIRASIVAAVAMVAAVVEEIDAGEAAPEKLVDGQICDGMAVILWDKALLMGSFVGLWVVNGNITLKNLKVYGMLFLNVHSVLRVFRSAAWVVLYFRWRQRGGDEVVGDHEDQECVD
ncbi:uncharacterized protein LOC127265014 [Andrographis paniculata]|uniref:uncharacterized protein LOC127265014 n=1 Tax=Andrographis paniculata TaxID=175694 RepID=UPI0021E7F938|nr:uncharacterized protein LOC127265014 [Andrographis paniculata]